MAYVVGIDIETTSLDHTVGHIIEVAAIRYDLTSGEETGRYQALCQAPHISEQTTALTGITPAMVAGLSSFSAHIQKLQEFIGSDTLLAHNAAFDLTWLSHHGLPLSNPVWDTFYLASLVWPKAGSYNLGTLAKEHNIEIEGEHRAEADIALTWQLFQAMRARHFDLPRSHKKIFADVLSAAGQSHYLPLFSFEGDKAESKSIKTITASPSLKKMSIGEVMGEQGLFRHTIPGFIPRAEQIKLTEYLLDCSRRSQSAIIEAGPGIGKTYAYLVAGLLAGGRLLISTYSKVLQDQIVSQDIPRVLEALGLPRTYTTLKGRRNYVCGARLTARLASKPLASEEAWILLKISLWLARGGSGDLEQVNLSHLNRAVVSTLHADHAICWENCRPETCPYQKARQGAASADIVVINHALLMQWALSAEQADHEDVSYHTQFSQLVVDEAHRLEEAAQKASQVEFSLERLHDIGSLPQGEALIADFKHLLERAQDVVRNHTQDNRLRLSHTVRRSQTAKKFLKEGLRFLGELRFTIGLLRSRSSEAKKVDQLERLAIEWEEMLTGRSPDLVHYIDGSGSSEAAKIITASLNTAAYTQPCLESITPTILLSATIAVEGKFSYIKGRLGIQNWEERTFSSPFDYNQKMSIFVTDDGPYPNQESHDLFVAKLISEMGKLTKGKIAVLFTSKKSLEMVHKSTSSQLYKEKVRLLSQGLSGGRHNIAKRFQEGDDAILFGLASFWEGFDSPGEALSILVIPKLPFPPVGDPLIEAMSETAGSKSFSEVMLPRMILRLKQGAGRLIRTISDRGVVVILDRRLAEKEYGRRVLHSLPGCPIRILESADLLENISEFFGPETITRWQGKP